MDLLLHTPALGDIAHGIDCVGSLNSFFSSAPGDGRGLYLKEPPCVFMQARRRSPVPYCLIQRTKGLGTSRTVQNRVV